MKFCMRARLLSGQVFSHFGELWLAGSHGGGITSRMYAATNWMQAAAPSDARWGFGNGCRGWAGRRHYLRPCGGICDLQACWRTCWFSLACLFVLHLPLYNPCIFSPSHSHSFLKHIHSIVTCVAVWLWSVQIDYIHYTGSLQSCEKR